jgi:hypothetical protein
MALRESTATGVFQQLRMTSTTACTEPASQQSQCRRLGLTNPRAWQDVKSYIEHHEQDKMSMIEHG